MNHPVLLVIQKHYDKLNCRLVESFFNQDGTITNSKFQETYRIRIQFTNGHLEVTEYLHSIKQLLLLYLVIII